MSSAPAAPPLTPWGRAIARTAVAIVLLARRLDPPAAAGPTVARGPEPAVPSRR